MKNRIKELSGILISFFLLTASQCGKNPEMAIFQPNDSGLFSIMDQGFAFIKGYDDGIIKGLQFDFDKLGLYYDPQKGPNWWSYYFEPIQLGTVDGNAVRVKTPIYKDGITDTEYCCSRAKIHELIQKYLHLKPYLQKQIDDFTEKNFKGFYVIGVHYRGTDKHTEAPRTKYERVITAIKNEIAKLNDKNYRIFIATDESLFLEDVQKEFPGKVIHLDDATRSSNGQAVHIGSKDPYKVGKEAIVDSILLSKTNFLIRTSSNLSRWSTYFNPTLPVLELSQRY